jgi:hypothetical protein
MNQFLIDGIPYHAVYRYVGTDHEERGGCCQLDGSDFQECQDCIYEGKCPADGEDE